MNTAAVTDAIQQVTHEVILPRFRTLDAADVLEKNPGDLVTIADREAEVELARIFRSHTPDALIVGEESSFADPSLLDGLADAEHAWVIDPVDGTNNFAHGKADFGVMVAELRRGVTTRAWIWQPIHEQMFVAEVGGGVTVNDRPVGRPGTGSDTLVAAVPHSLRERPTAGFELRATARACAIDYPMVLQGRLDVLGYRKLHPWDHLPGTLMLTEAGGRCATHEGRTYGVGVRGVVMFAAASPEVWARTDATLVTPTWLAEHGAGRRRRAR